MDSYYRQDDNIWLQIIDYRTVDKHVLASSCLHMPVRLTKYKLTTFQAIIFIVLLLSSFQQNIWNWKYNFPFLQNISLSLWYTIEKTITFTRIYYWENNYLHKNKHQLVCIHYHKCSNTLLVYYDMYDCKDVYHFHIHYHL